MTQGTLEIAPLQKHFPETVVRRLQTRILCQCPVKTLGSLLRLSFIDPRQATIIVPASHPDLC